MAAKSVVTPTEKLHQSIRELLLATKMQMRQTVNTAMAQSYWQIGRKIEENEKSGKPALHRQITCLNDERLLSIQDQSKAEVKLSQQDVGQMGMYVRVFDQHHRNEGDGATLCQRMPSPHANRSRTASGARTRSRLT